MVAKILNVGLSSPDNDSLITSVVLCILTRMFVWACFEMRFGANTDSRRNSLHEHPQEVQKHATILRLTAIQHSQRRER